MLDLSRGITDAPGHALEASSADLFFKVCGSSHPSQPRAAESTKQVRATLAHGRSDAEFRDGGLLEWYVHFGITAGSRCIHSGYNPFNVAAQSGPLLIGDNHERDFPAFQVLLVTDVFVSRQQKLETCRLSSRYQFAVKKPVPSSFDGFNHHMALERIPERGWSAVIEEYEHQPLGRGAAPVVRQGFAPQIQGEFVPASKC
jgi:hypothetical protein